MIWESLKTTASLRRGHARSMSLGRHFLENISLILLDICSGIYVVIINNNWGTINNNNHVPDININGYNPIL